MKKAILFGASGFIGSYLLDELLKNPDYNLVTVVVRKALAINHPKLKILIGDFQSLSGLINEMQADDVFICLGTTKKNTPDQKIYYQVDHDYPVLAAKLAKENGAHSVFVVSAIGANARSAIFYVRTKGEMERDIVDLGFDHTYIFRPSMLMGDRKEHRAGEKIFITVFRVINLLLVGSLNKYRGIEGADLAKAMNNAAKNPTEKVKYFYWKEIQGLIK